MKSLSIVILFFVPLLHASAQPGVPDSTFGRDGTATVSYGGRVSPSHTLFTQPDGNILLAGSVQGPTTQSDFTLWRCNNNGSPDTAFGAFGIVHTDISSRNDICMAAAVQADGKIVAVGASDNDVALIRYDSDGNPDGTFGTSGIVSTTFAPLRIIGNAVAIQPDGKIIVAGNSLAVNRGDIVLVRYNPDGSVDSTFGTFGKVLTDIEGRDDAINAVSVVAGGTIIVAGSSNGDVLLVGYKPNGSVDSAFGMDGIVIIQNDAQNETANSIIWQPDGEILIGALYNDHAAVLRFHPDGTSDTDFGSNGVMLATFGGWDYPGSSFALQKDGKIVVACVNLCVQRFNSDGKIDSSYGQSGTVGIYSSPEFTRIVVHAIALQPDGKIIMAYDGLWSQQYLRIRLVRLLSDPASVGVAFTAPSLHASVYPNPVHNTLVLEYTLQHSMHVTIRLTDMLGNTIAIFADELWKNEGTHMETLFLPDDVPSGRFILSMETSTSRSNILISHY